MPRSYLERLRRVSTGRRGLGWAFLSFCWAILSLAALSLNSALPKSNSAIPTPLSSFPSFPSFPGFPLLEENEVLRAGVSRGGFPAENLANARALREAAAAARVESAPAVPSAP